MMEEFNLMILRHRNRNIFTLAVWSLICWLSFPGFSIAQARPRRSGQESEQSKPKGSAPRYLFVWAGDQARQAPDFLAVVDFDEASPNYGKIITTVPLPGPGASG